jgi:hypothetical protein
MNKLKFINTDSSNVPRDTDYSNRSDLLSSDLNKNMSTLLEMQCSMTDLPNEVFHSQLNDNQQMNKNTLEQFDHISSKLANNQHDVSIEYSRSETSDNIVIDNMTDEPSRTDENDVILETPAVTSTQNKSSINVICIDNEDRSPDEDGFVLVRESNKRTNTPTVASQQKDDGKTASMNLTTFQLIHQRLNL